MKLKRTNKDYGGGGGKALFESELFRVMLWNSFGGPNTELEIKHADKEIRFDGHHQLKSDSACIKQLTSTDILDMIAHQRKLSYSAGRASKAREIRECLEI